MKHNLTPILTLVGLLLTAVLAACGICMTGGGLRYVLPPVWLAWLILLFVPLACLMNLKKAIQQGITKNIFIAGGLTAVLYRIALCGGILYMFWMQGCGRIFL